MLILEWLAEQAADLLGGLISERVRRRRTVELNWKRIAAFQAGRKVRIPCALRHVRSEDSRWRHGNLRLAQGAGAWIPRLHREPTVTVNRRTAIGQSGRRVTGHESFRLNPRLVVLSYRVADDVIELGVRKRDLAILGRAIELPPQPGEHQPSRPGVMRLTGPYSGPSAHRDGQHVVPDAHRPGLGQNGRQPGDGSPRSVRIRTWCSSAISLCHSTTSDLPSS
jgi:hypothetical protein